jgi:hypothetical protein
MPTAKKKLTTKNACRQGRAMPKSRFPAHLRVDTPEEWRALKRTEWREVMQALERYGYGAAFTPAAAALWEVQKAAQQVREAIEADGWIAW